MIKVRVCNKCFREKSLRSFPKGNTGLSTQVCRTCLLDHRLDEVNRSMYPGTFSQDEDWRVTVDSILDSLSK